MKKLLKFTVILVAGMVTIISCKKDEVDTDVPSKRVIFTSEQNQNNQVRLNSDLTFGDVSSGVISRTWRFPEGVANVTTSSQDVVKAVFTQVGEHNVTLSQTFEESAYVDGVQRGTQLDTTIVVTVIEPINIGLRANRINPDGTTGASLNLANGALNEVSASRSIRYSFDPAGLPQNIEWTLDGGNPETASGVTEVDVSYRRTGSYGVSVEAFTSRPFGEAFAEFTNLVNVVPSTDPVTLDEVKGRLDGTLGLVFSREMDPSSVVTSEYAITVQNGGADVPVTIQSVAVDPAEANVLLVTLSGDLVYVNDDVTVSYTEGSLFTADGVKAESFTNIRMGAFEQNPNDLEMSDVDFGFENSADETSWPYQFWGGIWELYDFSIDFSNAHSGTRSAVIDMQAGGGAILANATGTFSLVGGQSYEVGVWTYIEDVGGTPAGSGNPDLRIYWQPGTDFSFGPNPEFSADFPTNEWVYSSIFVTAADDANDKQILIRGFNEFNPSSLKVLVDDISFRKVTLRP